MGISRHRRRTIIDRASATAAAEWILERRTRIDDPDLWRFPDTDNLLGVVQFVERYQRVPDEDLCNDAIAALGILNYLAGEIDRRKMLAIRIARRTGATWATLAGPLGVKTYQAAEQVLVRLEALFEGTDGTRDETTGRRLRRQPRRRAAARPPARPTPSAKALAELRQTLGELITHRDLLDDDLAETVTLLRRETTATYAELADAELAAALRVLVGEMSDRAWPTPVQAAVERMVAALPVDTST